MKCAPNVCTLIALLAGSSVHADPPQRVCRETSDAFGFIENHGQWVEGIRFGATGANGMVGIEDAAIRFRRVAFEDGGGGRVLDLRLRFERARDGCRPRGRGRKPWLASFFRGSDPARWVSAAAVSGRVVHEDLYPGIDLVFRECDSALGEVEYDLLLAPGADLDQVVVSCEGADGIRLSADGSLEIIAGGSLLRQSPPRTWEELPGGGRVPLASSYRILGTTRFGFEARGRRPDLRLVLDPVVAWSTPLGSAGAGPTQEAREGVWGMALSGSGEVVAAGTKTAIDFPDEPPAGEECLEDSGGGGSFDVFVARFDAATGAILSTTVAGGAQEDSAVAVAIAPGGEIDVVGYTGSEEFPVTTETELAENPTGGREGGFDGFFLRLDPAACELLFSTFLGGRGEDVVTALTHLSGGDAIAIGYTAARDFPLTEGALMPAFRGGKYDAFLVRLDPESGVDLGDSLVYSTYFGGSGNDAYDRTDSNGFIDRIYSGGVAARSDDSVVFGGQSWSADLPATAEAFARTNAQNGDGYLAVLEFSSATPPQAALAYLTFLGGPEVDSVDAVVVSGDDSIWAAGYTRSTNFPTTSRALQGTHAGDVDAWVARLDSDIAGADGLVYASFLGGAQKDFLVDLAVRADGRLVVVGETTSPTVQVPATAGALAPSLGGSNDGYIAVFDPSADWLLAPRASYSSFIGSRGSMAASAVLVAESDRTFIGLQTATGPLAGIDEGVFFSNVGAVLALDLLLPRARISLGGAEGSCVAEETLLVLDGGASSTPEGSTLTGFAWRVGDGEPLEGPIVERRLEGNGIFAVELTVTNDLGLADSADAFVCVRSPLEQAALAPPYRSVDIGEPRYAGVTSPGEGGAAAFRSVAGGRGLLGTADSGHYVYREVEGDGAISTRVDSFSGGDEPAQAGVLLRSDLDPNSPFAALLVERDRLRFSHRAERGRARRIRTGPDLTALPVHIRLRRESTPENPLVTLIGEYSTDGVSWREVDRAEIDGAQLLRSAIAGVFAAGGDGARPSRSFVALEVSVSDLRWTPADAGNADQPFRRGDVDGSSAVELTDAISLLSCLFAGGACSSCRDAADANDDGALDVSDPILLLGYLFQGAEEIAEPGPVTCGTDPTEDELGCGEYEGGCAGL